MDILSQRQLELLKYIISQYIYSAKPISSGLVSKKSEFNLSPATIRNEMNELEDAGYLAQLHTSGGRVPTDKAYRLYVNDLIRTSDFELQDNYRKLINTMLAKAGTDTKEINKNIARTLSELTENLVITGISEEDQFFKMGLSSLFEMPEFKEFNRMFRMTSFFDEFDEMFNMLERKFFTEFSRFNSSPEIRIFIGQENPVNNIKDEAVVCAKYPLPDRQTGSLTLIGPTRMDYEKNISLIKYTIEKLNNLTNHDRYR